MTSVAKVINDVGSTFSVLVLMARISTSISDAGPYALSEPIEFDDCVQLLGTENVLIKANFLNQVLMVS